MRHCHLSISSGKLSRESFEVANGRFHQRRVICIPVAHEKQAVDHGRRWKLFAAPDMAFKKINQAAPDKEQEATSNSGDIAAHISNLKIDVRPKIRSRL